MSYFVVSTVPADGVMRIKFRSSVYIRLALYYKTWLWKASFLKHNDTILYGEMSAVSGLKVVCDNLGKSLSKIECDGIWTLCSNDAWSYLSNTTIVFAKKMMYRGVAESFVSKSAEIYIFVFRYNINTWTYIKSFSSQPIFKKGPYAMLGHLQVQWRPRTCYWTETRHINATTFIIKFPSCHDMF